MISDQELFELAKATTNKRVLSENATAGSVASALVTAGGNVFVGVCIDTACGMGFCAEHNAIGSMITGGESAIAAIVAVNRRGDILPPCGRCREFIYQVDDANRRTRVLLPNERTATIAELLPEHWMDIAHEETA
ncbi:MAG TPA: cytidine deaminase [Tepidiformaceae bacterium]|nr:cytidine deaminase [Tepidiformaceae bacterium]